MARSSSRTVEPAVKSFDRSDRIRQLMETGADNDAIISFFEGVSPEIILNDKQRRTKSKNGYVAPNKELREEILNQIRVTRTTVESDRASMEMTDARYGRGSVTKLSEAVAEEVYRISTSIGELDWLWGCHEETVGKKTRTFYGPPRSKITLMGGQRGVGKSRWIIMVICEMAYNLRQKSLIFQNEVTGGEYAKWVKNYMAARKMPAWVLDYITTSDQGHLDDQMKTIQEIQPDLVIVDSINMIKEAKTDAGQYEMCYLYHKTCHAMPNHGPHVIFVGHMNKSGEIKGSTAIQHYVDIIMYVTKTWIPGRFKVSLPDKNRYGETGGHREFAHDGPRVVSIHEEDDKVVSLMAALRAAK